MLRESQYHELLEKHKDKRLLLEVDFLELGILLGSIKLMLQHPEVQEFSMSFHQYVQGLQGHILSKYAEIGLSKEDINDLAEQWI